MYLDKKSVMCKTYSALQSCMCPGPSRLINVIIILKCVKSAVNVFIFACYSVTMMVGFVLNVR